MNIVRQWVPNRWRGDRERTKVITNI